MKRSNFFFYSINISKIHFFSLLSFKRNSVYSSKSIYDLMEKATFRRVECLRPFFFTYMRRTCIFGPDLLVPSEIAGEGMPRGKISPLTSDDENAMDG